MVDLCHEILTSNYSADFPFGVFKSLSQAFDAEFARGRVQSLDQVIECLRDAVKMCPSSSHRVLLALADTLRIRFDETHSNVDYEEAWALLERVLDPNQPGECLDSIRVLASHLQVATSLAFTRSLVFRDPQYSEVTTSRLRTLLSSPFVDEGLRFRIPNLLTIQARERFRQYSLAESLEEVQSYASQVVDLSSSQSLKNSGERLLETSAVWGSYSMTRVAEKIQHLEEVLSITPPGTERHKMCLIHLASWYESKFCRTDDVSDVEESIEYCRLSLDAIPSSDPWRHNPLGFLRNVLFLAFEQTNNQLPG